MKILLLSDACSPHTVKWVRSLADSGISIGLFGLSACDFSLYGQYPNVVLYTQKFTNDLIRQPRSLKKIRYLTLLPRLYQAIRQFQPDIIHAHYASSYGLLGALSRFKPYIVSVWGSDVFDFPKNSFLNRKIIKYNLSKADVVLSTSHVMAHETRKYTDKSIIVTPFGIDLTVFKPCSNSRDGLLSPGDIVIGTVKTLEEKYGIEYLIRAFALVRRRHPPLPLKLLIVGGGSQEFYLKRLAGELMLTDEVIFIGKVAYEDVVRYHNMLDISVSVSDSESFGVAVIEASACEKPVVVSNVGGLPEVVADGVTGIVVEPRNPEQTATAIEKLVIDTALRRSMGQAGRARVKQLFNWHDNVQQMIGIYEKVLSKK